jgi:hypothetical protein
MPALVTTASGLSPTRAVAVLNRLSAIAEPAGLAEDAVRDQGVAAGAPTFHSRVAAERSTVQDRLREHRWLAEHLLAPIPGIDAAVVFVNGRVRAIGLVPLSEMCDTAAGDASEC